MGVLKYVHNAVMPLYKPSALGSAIAESMTNTPDDWKLGEHTTTHVPSGIEIWAANDAGHREIYAAPGIPGFRKANKDLSYGDRILIDELIAKLRKRSSAPGKFACDAVIQALTAQPSK